MPGHQVRQFNAWEDETVFITWHLKDGRRYSQRVTLPPVATRNAHDVSEPGEAHREITQAPSPTTGWGDTREKT